jgi:hypothetical protein
MQRILSIISILFILAPIEFSLKPSPRPSSTDRAPK